MRNITFKILLIMTTLFFYCGKNYHSKGYSDSDEYDGIIGKSLMNANFFNALIEDLNTRGIIKKADPIDSTKIYLSTLKNIDTLNLNNYPKNIMFPSNGGFKGIEFFPSLKVLNVEALSFSGLNTVVNNKIINNDSTSSIRLIRELYRVRNLFNLDTNKIFYNPILEKTAETKIIFGVL